MTNNNDYCSLKLNYLINLSKDLICQCQLNENIIGISKLIQKLKSEQKFLLKLERINLVKKSHLNSSNLTHLNAIVKSFQNLPNVTSVLQLFSCSSLSLRLTIDIVCNNGATWIKVVARNSKALIAESLGQKDFGEKTLVDQALDIYEVSKNNLHNFKLPTIVFLFVHSIPKRLAKRLKACKIHVAHLNDLYKEKVIDLITESEDILEDGSYEDNPLKNIQFDTHIHPNKLLNYLFSGDIEKCKSNRNILPQDSESNLYMMDIARKSFITEDADDRTDAQDSVKLNLSTMSAKPFLADINWCWDDCICHHYFENEYSKPTSDLYAGLSLANLDITALMALVSNLSHGSTNHNFKTNVLKNQAAEEMMRPVLEDLIPFLKRRELFVCRNALTDFQKILDFVGGARERQRAFQLMQCLHVVDDVEFDDNLQETSRMSKRAWRIFKTGNQLRAITITANKGFIRAAHQMKFNFVCFIHDARALTESKEPH